MVAGCLSPESTCTPSGRTCSELTWVRAGARARVRARVGARARVRVGVGVSGRLACRAARAG